MKPSRKVSKSYRNVTGRIASPKSKEVIQFESKLERDFYYLFDFDNSIIEIVHQPKTIKYNLDGNLREYTPDVFLRTYPGRPNILGEIKYHDDMKTNMDDYRIKFEAARIYCDQLSEPTQFHLFTDRCNQISNEDYRFNIHFLHRYRNFFKVEYDIVVDLYKNQMTIGEILVEFSDNQTTQMEFLPSIYAMIRRRVLSVDLTKKLTLNSNIVFIRDYDEEIWQQHTKGLIQGGYLI